jgi:DNA-binding transcriptional LysR family regulator
MLDVRRMVVLREVAARGSFSAAAEALAFTQSAVSQQVAALERETGARLVDRGARGVRLTEAGRALVTHADAILARLNEAEEELAAIAGLRGGRLRIGTFPSVGATLVPAAVATFRRRHPDVELSMAEGEPEDTIPRLKAGDLDLALIFDYHEVPLAADADLERTHLVDDVVDVVLPRGHPLAARRTVKLEELADEHWICGCSRSSCAVMIHRSCSEAGFEAKVGFESDDYQVVQALVAANVGVTMLPRLCLTTVHPEVEVRSLGRAAPVRRVGVVPHVKRLRPRRSCWWTGCGRHR